MKNNKIIAFLTKSLPETKATLELEKKRKLPKAVSVIVRFVLIMFVLIFFGGFCIAKTIEKYTAKFEQADSTALLDFKKAEPIEVTLTQKQKEQDFLYLYDALKKGCPGASIEVNGRSFIDKKKEYLEIIADTKSNAEYYYALSAIFSSIPSAHTRLLIDKTAFTSYTASYNACNVILPENASYTAYWDELFMNSITNIDISDHIEFLYVGGKYIYSPNYSCLGAEYKNSILISVNDIPIDEYITEKTYPSTIRYDANNEKWYRARADFNATDGENAQVKIKKADGTEETLDLYFDIADSAKFLINYSSEKHKDDDIQKKCYSLGINGNIAYLKLDSFADSSVFELKEKLPDIPYDIPLIIDIRDNTGGYIDYVTEFLYPLIYSDDYTYNSESFVKISGDLKSVVYLMMSLFGSNTYKLTYKNFNLSGFHYRMKEEINIKGGDAPKRDIYVLTGRNTISAADMFAEIAKEQENTLLIGSNTMGEGIFANYYMDILPNSKMVYLFIPSYAENTDGMDNSVYGTSPDIYSELSIENFIIQQELIENGEDPYTYENRLKWDNVLIKTLELIKEDVDDKGNNAVN